MKILWFLTQKWGGLEIFFGKFFKIFTKESKIWQLWEVLKSSTKKLINNWKFFLHAQKNAVRFTIGGVKKNPPPVLKGLRVERSALVLVVDFLSAAALAAQQS